MLAPNNPAGEHRSPPVLRSLTAEALVVGPTAHTSITQVFLNSSDAALEVEYVFPMDADASPCSLEATVAGRTIRGVVREAQAAADAYDDAVASGGQGLLLQRDASQPDLWRMSLGNLPPGSEASVSLSYVGLLPQEPTADAADGNPVPFRYTLPLGFPARWRPPGTAADAPADATAAPPPYGDVVVVLKGGGSVQSPSHAASLAVSPEGADVRATVSGARAADGDLVLLLSPPSATPGCALYVAEEEAGEGVDSTAAVLSWSPEALAAGAFERDDHAEVVFVVDRSGSMRGERIRMAAQVLVACVSSLPENTRFNIVGFGTRLDVLFDDFQPLTDDSKARALRYSRTMGADLGGTDVLAAFQRVVGAQPVRRVVGVQPAQLHKRRELQQRAALPPGSHGRRQQAAEPPTPSEAAEPPRPRSVLLITDGSVANAEAVAEYAAKDNRARGTRYFAFGIGSGASSGLVKGVAKAGKGAAEMLADGERIEAKVLRQVARAVAPALSGVTVAWGADVLVASVPPVMCQEDRLHAVGLLRSRPEPGVEVVVRAMDPDRNTLEARSRYADAVHVPAAVLNAVVASRVLRQLVESHRDAPSEEVKQHIKAAGVAFSQRSGVAVDGWTSFVATAEAEEGAEAAQGGLRFVRVRALADDRDGRRRQRRARRREAEEAPRSFNRHDEGVYAMRDLPLSNSSLAVDMLEPECLCMDAPSDELAARLAALGESLPAPVPAAAQAAPVSEAQDAYGERSEEEAKTKRAPRPGYASMDDVVVELLGLQAAGGAWSPSQRVLHLLELREADVHSALPDGAALEVFFTLVVVQWLRVRVPQCAATYGMAVRKAQRWAGLQSAAVEAMGAAVEGLIGA